jgi:peptidoglycan/xylan/chitin deacetylase (PgdA/CDA1 family)
VTAGSRCAPPVHWADVERVTSWIEEVRDGRPVVDGRPRDVANVVWATGFRQAFDWIRLPVVSPSRLAARAPSMGRSSRTNAVGVAVSGNDETGGRWRRRQTAELLLARSPMLALARRLNRHRLCVLAYHSVRDAAQFAEQLDWVTANMTPVSLDLVRRHLLAREPLPSHPVLLTFDDGDRSVFKVAAPLLRARGVPAVAYVVAGLVDTDLPFWWSEVEELSAQGASPKRSPSELVRQLKRLPDSDRRAVLEGMRSQAGTVVRMPQLTSEELRTLERDGVEIGNHSLTHPCLDKCDDEAIRREVVEAHESLAGALGHPPTSFAYPNGNWDDRVRRTVAAAGYDLAFAFDHRLVPSGQDTLSLSRVRVDASADLDRFRILASGLHPWLHRLRGRT